MNMGEARVRASRLVFNSLLLLSCLEIARGYAVLHDRSASTEITSMPIHNEIIPQREQRIPSHHQLPQAAVAMDEDVPIERMSQHSTIPLCNHLSTVASLGGGGSSTILEDLPVVRVSPHVCSRPQSSKCAFSQHKPTAPSTTVTPPFSPLERWCLSKLDRWYSRSQSLKCPFFRRRSGDLLDSLEGLIRKVVIRSDRRPYLGPPQAFRPVRINAPPKQKGLSPEELSVLLRKDWKALHNHNHNHRIHPRKNNHKGYYLTGRLSTSIYRDDCLFVGPDPDLPIRGLRKYMGVANHLFEYHASTATLLSLDIVEEPKIAHHQTRMRPSTISTLPSPLVREKPNAAHRTTEDITHPPILVAKWKLDAVLRLPWKPRLPKLSGQTIYHTDSDGLIWCHEEHWEDCSTPRAFCATFLPGIADILWPQDEHNRSE